MITKDILKHLAHKHVFLGFDAFVDAIARPVRTGSALHPESYFDGMSDFALYLQAKGNMSCSVELEEITEKLGGNMAIVANALSGLGVQTHCVGPFGLPSTHPAFRNMALHCDLYSVGNPGACTALEFNSGKLMLGTNRDLNHLDYAAILAHVSVETLRALAAKSEILCFLNWSELPCATDIFIGFRDNVLRHIPGKRLLFVDLSDCSRRTAADIQELMDVLAEMPENVDVALSMNKNEENILTEALGIPQTDCISKGQWLAARYGFAHIFFHDRHMNHHVRREAAFSHEAAFIENPVLLSGAGDNFNAGLIAGMLMDLPGNALLTFAIETARHYLQHGASLAAADCN